MISETPLPREFAPALDPAFQPAILFFRAYRRQVAQAPTRETLEIGLERENGLVARWTLELLPSGTADAATWCYVERFIKFILWSRGGCRLFLAGPAALCAKLAAAYAPGGERHFDCEVMGKAYAQPFATHVVAAADMPAERRSGNAIGGHWDGCRVGFDLGASDYKLAAVIDGQAVFTAEVPWHPTAQADPEYHRQHILGGIRQAAAHLPRVDAIGGSSAGIFVDNEPRVASLFRAVPPADFAQAVRPLFHQLAAEWQVPVVVANDGDVTALAGAESFGCKAILGVAMGSSEAGGWMDAQGCITGWLNELAFAPVDLNPAAVADEWSGDRGVGALYFSQQAVNKLAPAAGFRFPAEMLLPERLKLVQERANQGDPAAQSVFTSIGVYLGYTLPWYEEFYGCTNTLLLGRVTSGVGGDLVLATAKAVLEREFPETAARLTLRVPDETFRRLGQAVAAASLPQRGGPA